MIFAIKLFLDNNEFKVDNPEIRVAFVLNKEMWSRDPSSHVGILVGYPWCLIGFKLNDILKWETTEERNEFMLEEAYKYF